MTHRIRRIIFYSFTVIFVIATVLISLHATGYHFNLNRPFKISYLLTPTGTLIIDSDPQGATVYLNGKNSQTIFKQYFSKNTKISTPNKIKNLVPDEYLVNVILDGYWPYQKKIRVYPKESTYLENIVLFKKDLPIKVIDANIQPLELSTDKQFLKLVDDQKTINIKTEQVETNIAWQKTKDQSELKNFINDKNLKFLTIKNSQWAYYATDLEIFSFDGKSGKKYLITRFSAPLTSLIYHPKDYLIYSNKDSINMINLNDTNDSKTFISLEKLGAPILNASADTLYFTAKIGQQNGLYKLAIE